MRVVGYTAQNRAARRAVRAPKISSTPHPAPQPRGGLLHDPFQLTLPGMHAPRPHPPRGVSPARWHLSQQMQQHPLSYTSQQRLGMFGFQGAVALGNYAYARRRAIARQQQIPQLAHRIAYRQHVTPQLVKHLQRLQHEDLQDRLRLGMRYAPSFQDQLNNEIQRITQLYEAKVAGSPQGIIGKTVETAVNPLEWAKIGVEGVGQLRHGHYGAGALSLASVLPISRGPRALVEGVRAYRGAEEAIRTAEALRAARVSYRSGQGLVSPVVGAGIRGVNRLRPSVRTLERGLGRNELFAHYDSIYAPTVAAAHKRVFDQNLRAMVKRGEARNLKEAAQILAPHEMAVEGGVLHQIDQFHDFPQAKKDYNLRGKLNPRTQRSGLPSKRAVLTNEGLHFAGEISPEAWVDRVVATHPTRAERNHAARWYSHFEPLFREHFPPEVVDAIMRGFAVSQANASPSGGLGSALVALERIMHGEEPGSIGSVVADNIGKALRGQPIDSHVAAKLSDFIDALRGKKTRTWMGDHPAGGAPAPIDIWGLRDLGYIDAKIGSKGRDRRLLRMHGVNVNRLKRTSTGSASGARYERAAEKYHEITDHLNAIRFDGRGNWTPEQTQALGWSAIQKFYGQTPEGLGMAIGKARGRALRMTGGPSRPTEHFPEGTLFQDHERGQAIGDTFNPQVAQVHSEIRPLDEHWPERAKAFDQMAPEERARYAHLVDQAVGDDLEHALGLHVAGRREGAGIWRGVATPGIAHHILIDGELTDGTRAELNALAAAKGLAKHQTSVSWGIPRPQGAGEFEGIHWVPPEGADPAQLSAAMDTVVGPGNVGFIHAPDGGYYVIDFQGRSANLSSTRTAIRNLGGEQTHIGWDGGYAIDKRNSTEPWEETYQAALEKLPAEKRSALELAMTKIRKRLDLIDQHYFSRPGAHLVNADEARALAEKGTHVFHGTGGLNAEQIMAERRLRVGGSAPEAAWTTIDPEIAAWYAPASMHGERNIVAIPKDQLPFGAGTAMHEGRSFFNRVHGEQEDILFQHGADRYAHMSTDELHAEMERLHSSYNDLLDEWAAAEGRPGDFKRVTAFQNARAKKMARRGTPYPTVREQMRSNAESKLQAALDANPDDPIAQAIQRDQAEAWLINREIYRRNDELFQGTFGDRVDRVLAAIHRYGADDKSQARWLAEGPKNIQSGKAGDDLFRFIARGIGKLSGHDRQEAEAVLEELRLHQEARPGPKGAFVRRGDTAQIHFFEGADVSTAAHELAHFNRAFNVRPEEMPKLAEWAGAEQQADGTFNWSRAAEERYARAVEWMYRNGQAPRNLVPEWNTLRPEFEKIYKPGELEMPPQEIQDIIKAQLGHDSGSAVLHFLVRHARQAAGAGRLVARTAEEADSHISDAAATARAEGFRAGPPIERFKPGEVTPETGGEAGGLVRDALSGHPRTEGTSPFGYEAAAIRGETKSAAQAQVEAAEMYRLERGKRAGMGSSAFERAGGGLEGLHAKLGAFKGDLPKPDFPALKGLDQETVDNLINHIENHPDTRLGVYDRTNAQQAIVKMLAGEPPSRSEAKMLYRIFGRNVTDAVRAAVPLTKGQKIMMGLNVPRALMATFDLSAALRQGLVVLAARPGLWAKNVGPMVKAFGSEKYFDAAMQSIEEMETHSLALKGGVNFSGIGEGADILAHEDPFMGGQIAERFHELPGVRSVPVLRTLLKGVSAGVRASDRAYTGFLNLLRAQYFDRMVRGAADMGHDVNNEELLHSLGRYVNTATGRGNVGPKLQKALPVLNATLFSPRLLKARVDMLNPYWYAKLDPVARREAMRGAMNLAITVSAVLELAHMSGAKVELDPRSADWGKIRVGNTRIDLLGGFQQPIRLAAQLATGEIKSSTTGRMESLSSGAYGSRSRLDVAERFFQSKEAPVASFITDMLRGKDFAGQPFSVKKELANHLTPLMLQDAFAVRQNPALALGAGVMSGVGLGVQSYGPPDPGAKRLSKIQQDTKDAGLGQVPKAVLADAKWKGKLDAATYAGQKPYDKMMAAAKIFDERYGTHFSTQLPQKNLNAAQADKMYQELAGHIAPIYDHWESAVTRVLNAKAGQQNVHTPPAPEQRSSAPAEVTNLQPVAYHPATASTTVPHGRVLAAHHTTGLPPQLATAIQTAASTYHVPASTLAGIWRIESGSTYPNPAVNSSGYGGLFGTTKWNASTQEQANYAAQTLKHLLQTHGGNMAAALSAYSGGGYSSVSGGGGGWHAGRPSGGGGGAVDGLGGSAWGSATSGGTDAALETMLQHLAAGNYNPSVFLTKTLHAFSEQPLSGNVAGINFQLPLGGRSAKAARGAIALAEYYLGTPYAWGGESPSGFDCSGLLQYVYAKQGVQIPRTSQAQFQAGRKVGRGQLRPGDAVFFHMGPGGPEHEGMYIGGGRFIEAPHTGATVRISNLRNYPGYVGARRFTR